MQKSRLLIVALGILGLAVFGGSGCSPNLSVPGGNVWPARVRVVVTVPDPYSNLTISWRGRKLQTAQVANSANIGGSDDDPDMSFTTSSTPASFTHTFPVSARLTAGTWRFETTIRGDGRSIAVVCDQVLPGSESWDNPTVVELAASPTGCTTAVGLQATSIVTDFSEFEPGQQPYDWTTFGNTANSTWTVQADSSSGENRLQGTQTANGVRGIFWAAAGQPDDVEILAKVRTRRTDTTVPSPMLFVRGGVTAGSPEGYAAGLRGGNRLIGVKFRGGTPPADLAQQSVPFGYVADSWIWMRFRIEGNTISAKAWPAGAVEPADFFWSLPDSSGTALITGAGRVGVLTFDANADPGVGLFSVAVGGTHALPRLAQTCPNQEGPYYVCP